MGDHVRFQRGDGDGHRDGPRPPEAVSPPSDQDDQEGAQQQVAETPQGEHVVGRHGGCVEECLADLIVVRAPPLLRRRLEREPMTKEERRGEETLDQRGGCPVETEVVCRQVRVARREIPGLVVGRGLVADDRDTLHQEQDEEASAGDEDQPARAHRVHALSHGRGEQSRPGLAPAYG